MVLSNYKCMHIREFQNAYSNTELQNLIPVITSTFQ